MQNIKPPAPTMITRAVASVYGFMWMLPVARDVRGDINPFIPPWKRNPPFDNVITVNV